MTDYVGRFAPSPTGPLHFGSLVAAVASYLQALAHAGQWLVRIDDIDPPREQAGAIDVIVATLSGHGFRFAPPRFQSDRAKRYQAVIDELIARGDAYRCACSRKEIHAIARIGRAGAIYPGTCRAGDVAADALAIRLRTDGPPVRFVDGLQGPQECRVEAEIGDFLLRRSDGLFSYHLAAVVDDHEQGITEVVRGTDLLDSTFPQLALQRALGLDQPGYMHFPVVVNADGQKLSKQTRAAPIDQQTPLENLYKCLLFLHQQPPSGLLSGNLEGLWSWAEAHWRPDRLAGIRSGPEPAIMMQ